nr:caspase family protein [Streptomyces sp. NBC_01001]
MAMTGSLLGPGRRDALLIATGTYDDRTLSALRSPGQDCAGLAGVLADPRIGGFRTEQLKDAGRDEVMRALERFFLKRSRDDLLLVHVSCHGIKDDDGHLHFAARDTDRDLLAATAVPATFVHGLMERCRARTIVILLDCCYSGAFLPGVKGDDQVHVQEELGGHGTAILTATNRTEYAWEGERVETKMPQPSRFTGALIEGLASGAADLNRDGQITVTELYDYVCESLLRAGVRQHPRIWTEMEYKVTIARAVSDRGAARETEIPPLGAGHVPPLADMPAGTTAGLEDRTVEDIADPFCGGRHTGTPPGSTRTQTGESEPQTCLAPEAVPETGADTDLQPEEQISPFPAARDREKAVLADAIAPTDQTLPSHTGSAAERAAVLQDVSAKRSGKGAAALIVGLVVAVLGVLSLTLSTQGPYLAPHSQLLASLHHNPAAFYGGLIAAIIGLLFCLGGTMTLLDPDGEMKDSVDFSTWI